MSKSTASRIHTETEQRKASVCLVSLVMYFASHQKRRKAIKYSHYKVYIPQCKIFLKGKAAWVEKFELINLPESSDWRQTPYLLQFSLILFRSFQISLTLRKATNSSVKVWSLSGLLNLGKQFSQTSSSILTPPLLYISSLEEEICLLQCHGRSI